MPARARRLVDADLERVRALGDARAAITRERRAHVEARAVASADAAAEDAAPLHRRGADADLEPRGGRVDELAAGGGVGDAVTSPRTRPT